jgi:anaerobic magnesium-protoporphyrin IX monomethyl ester cyclase
MDDRVFPSLGLLKVGAVLEEAGYAVEHIDLSGVDNFEDVVRDYVRSALDHHISVCDLVFAITATTPQIPAAISIRSVLQGKTIIGGPHATLLNAAAKRGNERAQVALRVLLGTFDTVVCGDGELAIFRALREYGLIDADNPQSELWMSSKKFTESPWPARHLVDLESYHYSIEGERAVHIIGQLGCPMSCVFCAGRNSPMLRRMRLRDPSNIVAEIVHLHEKYGYKGFNFFDDEVNINKLLPELLYGLRKAAEDRGIEWRLRGFIKAELFTEEQAHLMYEAGFRWILIGFESGSDRILANIEKRATRAQNTAAMDLAHKHGLKVKALMSIGHAGESDETVRATYDWLLETKPDDLDVTVITPYPGSPYWDEAEQISRGVWRYRAHKTGDFLYMEEVDFSHVSDFYKGTPGDYVSHVWTDFLSKEELCSLRDWCEFESKEKLGISMPQTVASMMYDHSAGMTPSILRSSGSSR